MRDVAQSVDEMDAQTAELERLREKATEIKYITHIELGGCEINTWYYSPYPEEYVPSRQHTCHGLHTVTVTVLVV